MPKQKLTYTPKEQTSPEWAMDELDRHALIAGGGFLKASAFTANTEGKRYVPAGTLIGRTWVQQTAKEGFSPFDPLVHTETDGQVYATVYDVYDASEDAHCSLYRHGCQIRAVSFPSWTTLAAEVKERVRMLYEII